jgi:DNA-binding LacI/PurR family transcriptional regulator
LKQHLISEKVRKRIMHIAEKYEYEPRSAARSLAHGKSFQLGIILHKLDADLSSPNLVLFLSEFCKEAIRNNYQTIILPIEGGEFDSETVKTIRSSRADGYLIGAPLIGMRTMDELAKRNIPVVSYVSDGIPPDCPNITYVHTDNTAAYENMFRTIKEHGFESLNIFAHRNMKNSPRLDIQFYLDKYELELEDKIFFECSTFSAATWRESYKAASKMMDKIKKRKLFFCSSDFIALGLCDALQDANCIPGKDVSVVAYDNCEEHQFAIPGYTAFLDTVEKNDRLAGKQAVKRLLADINSVKQNIKNRVINIPTEFIHRKSLGWNN